MGVIATTFRLGLVAGLAALAPATVQAVEIVGTMQLRLIDFGSSGPIPDPLLIGSPGPVSASFTYDTAAAGGQGLSPDGRVGKYLFTQSASLSLRFNNETYSTTASAANPIEIDVAGNNLTNDVFTISPAPFTGTPPLRASAADASNPLAAFPFLNFLAGSALPDGTLPTASFPIPGGAFDQPFAYLQSVVPRSSNGYYLLRFDLEGPVTVTVVPEPASVGLVWLAGLGLIAAGAMHHRRRRTGSHTTADV